MTEATKSSNHDLSPAARDVLAERRRQIEVEGWDSAHDDEHEAGVLATAGAVYARNATIELHPSFIGPRMDAETAMRRFGWPWHAAWWKPKGPRRDLVRAAALILAEIERLDRGGVETEKHDG